MLFRFLLSGAPLDASFPAGTQAAGKWRFTMQTGSDPVITHLEDTPATTFLALAPGTYTATFARMGVDTVTVLGDVKTMIVAAGGNVTIQVAGSFTAQISTTP